MNKFRFYLGRYFAILPPPTAAGLFAGPMLAVLLLIGCAGDSSPSLRDRTGQTPAFVSTLPADAENHTPSLTPTPTTEPTATPSPTLTPQPTATPTPTPQPTATPTPTPQPTATPTPTPTPQPTATPTPTPTPQPTATPTPTVYNPSADGGVTQLADIDPELGERVASFDWVADGLTGKEWIPLSLARDLANHDVETAKILLNYPYMADELSELELQALRRLSSIARKDPEWARFLVDQLPCYDGCKTRLLGKCLRGPSRSGQSPNTDQLIITKKSDY